MTSKELKKKIKTETIILKHLKEDLQRVKKLERHIEESYLFYWVDMNSRMEAAELSVMDKIKRVEFSILYMEKAIEDKKRKPKAG